MFNWKRSVLAAMVLSCLLCGCLPLELSFSPTGTVAIPREEGFFAYDTTKGSVQALYFPAGEKAAFAQYSPDGKQLMLISTGKSEGMGKGFVVETMPVGGGERRKIFSGTNLTYARWSPDGQSIAITKMADSSVAPVEENLPELFVVNLADGSSKKLLANTSIIQRWFRDSKHILAVQITGKDKEKGDYLGQVVQVDLANGKTKPLASLIGPNKIFFDISPDNTSVLFTAIKAGKATDKLNPAGAKESHLQVLDLATGIVRSLKIKAEYAIYSPKGGHVLVGTSGENNLLKLEVYDAAMAHGVAVANDAGKQAGDGPDSVSIYPGWMNEEIAFYLRVRANYGLNGKTLQLVTVDVQGKNRKNHQPMIESQIRE